jgi:hypothetical protein
MKQEVRDKITMGTRKSRNEYQLTRRILQIY